MSLIPENLVCHLCGGYDLTGMGPRLRTLRSRCKCYDEPDEALTSKVESELRFTIEQQRRRAA